MPRNTGRCTAGASRTRTDSGPSRQAHRLVQAVHQGQEHLLRYPKVSIKWFEDGALNVSYNCIDRHLKKRGDQIAIIWEGDNPVRRQEDHLQRALRACLPPRQRAEEARRQEGRPRHHLHADDPGSRLCDARLHAHRRHPFGRLRRLLAGRAGRPHRRLQARPSSSPPTRACAAASRSRSRTTPTRRSTSPPSATAHGQERAGRAPHRRQDRLGRRPRPLVPRRGRHGLSRLPAGEDEGRGPAVHPLHLGLDRQAEGRAAHHRRLSRLRRR